MNTLDLLRAIADRAGVSPSGMGSGSEALRYVVALETHFGILPRPRAYVGERLKAISRAAMRPGDRVTYVGVLLKRYTGKTGVLDLPVNDGWMVTFDGETKSRLFHSPNLRLETLKMPNNNSIVNSVTTAVATFFRVSTPSSVSIAARELLAASTLATIANNRKERAKKALQTLGITLPEYRPGTVVAYSGSDFTIEAVTKEPSQRLDETELKRQLSFAGLSRAKIDAAFVAARLDNKPATSIVVTEK